MSKTRYGFANAINGFFEFPTDNARRIVPKGMEPVEPHHGTSILAVTVFDFHESEVGEYGEVVYAVIVPPLVREGRLPKSAFYPWQVATTTRAAREHAIERWHLPHWMQDVGVEFLRGPGRVTARVCVEGAPAMEMTITDHSWPMSDNLSLPVSIQRVRKETSLSRTFLFDHSFAFSAGQFVMVWIPGVDEIPMALSSENTITVQKAGDATTAMFALGAGDKLGIRGPFGNGFTKGEKVLAIAGGVGAAPLLPLARADCVMTLLLGARTEHELLFVDQLDECTDVLIATDDGTLGMKGFVTGLMDDLNLGAYDSGSRSAVLKE